MSETTSGGEFGNMPPKMSFLFGLTVGIAVIASIGFVLVLKRGEASQGTVSEKNTNTTALAPTVAQPSPTVVEDTIPIPSGSGDIQMNAISKDEHIRGNVNAQVSVVEYSDLECPYCKRIHPTLKQVLTTYGDKVNWVYRHFPLDSLHSKARKEAEATECAAELGGNDVFWAYVDKIYEITPSNDGLDPAQLPKIAKEVGLDTATFEECLNSGRHAKTVQEHYNQAIAAG